MEDTNRQVSPMICFFACSVVGCNGHIRQYTYIEILVEEAAKLTFTMQHWYLKVFKYLIINITMLQLQLLIKRVSSLSSFWQYFCQLMVLVVATSKQDFKCSIYNTEKTSDSNQSHRI